MFARAWRLSRTRDVQKVYRQGASAATNSLFIRTLPNRLRHPRLTVIVGKKVAKKAVVRNRLKRLVRQAIQELMNDTAFIARIKSSDVIVTIHKDPQPPYELERMRSEVARCFDRLPSA